VKIHHAIISAHAISACTYWYPIYQIGWKSTFWISAFDCKLTILPDIQPANRIVINSFEGQEFRLTPVQNRRQKIVDRGTLRLCRGALRSCRGAWHSNLNKIPLIYSVSYFNLGGLELCLGGLSLPNPPSPWQRDSTGVNKISDLLLFFS